MKAGLPSSLPAAVAAALLTLASAAGCSRYPDQDAPSVRQMTMSEHLTVLNGYLAHGGRPRRLASRDQCHLVLKKTLDSAATMQRIVIPLLETSVELATRPSGHGLRVKLTQQAEGQRQVWLRLDLEHWVDAVAWRSHFQQLQLNCRDVLEDTSPH